jgi:hypothetical protein
MRKMPRYSIRRASGGKYPSYVLPFVMTSDENHGSSDSIRLVACFLSNDVIELFELPLTSTTRNVGTCRPLIYQQKELTDIT